MLIRRAIAADRKRIVEILDAAALFTEDQIEAATRQVDESLENPDRGEYIVHVAEEGGEVRGYTSYGPMPNTDRAFDLYWIAVDPRFHGRGIGKRLLRFVESEVRKQNGATLHIETSSSDAFRTTRDFYRRCGYTEITRIKDFYRLEHDKVIFCRTLS